MILVNSQKVEIDYYPNKESKVRDFTYQELDKLILAEDGFESNPKIDERNKLAQHKLNPIPIFNL